MTSERLLVLASYMRDVSVSLERVPDAGETVVGASHVEGHGGKGSNQAIQAALCGAKVALIASVGSDPAGEEAVAFWRREGIGVEGVARAATARTGLATILVDRTGENRIVIVPGANSEITPAMVSTEAARIEASAMVLAQLEVPLPAIRRLFELARDAGRPTILNAAPARRDLDDALLGLTDYLVVNEGEALQLARFATDPGAAASELARRTRRGVVLTLGSRGAELHGRDGTLRRRPALPVAVVDTTGAGDAFVGAFCAALVHDGDPEAALALGVAAGSLACRAVGASASFAGGSEIVAAAQGRTTRMAG